MIRTPVNSKMVTFWLRDEGGKFLFRAYRQEDYIPKEYNEEILHDINFYDRVLTPTQVHSICAGCSPKVMPGWIPPRREERKTIAPKFKSLEEEETKIPFLEVRVTEFFSIAHFIYQRVNENKNLNAVNITEGALVSIPDDRLCTLLDVTISWCNAGGMAQPGGWQTRPNG